MSRIGTGLTLLFVLLLSSSIFGQSVGNITGTVTDDATGETLPGVNVIVVELNVGATTDIDGNYTIARVPVGDYTLRASFVGYRPGNESVTVTAGQQLTVNYQLFESAVNLDEVVVTGTGGAVEKKKLGNTIASIDVAALESAPVSSFSDVLQGREAGVVGLPSSGQTGEGTRIRIRGSASLSQNNEPVVYIDGVRINNRGDSIGAGGGANPSRLDDINPSAIAKVEILKGAAAATLYGTEASNGVIQIFTKQGSVGAPKFDFSTQQGLTSFPSVVPDNTGFASNAETAATMSEVLGGNIQPYELVSFNATEDLFETGYKQSYVGSVSGGSPGISYFVSGRYYNEDGAMGGNDSGRYSADYYPEGTQTLAQDISELYQLSASISAVPADNVRLRLSTYYTDRFQQAFDNNNNIYGVSYLSMFGKPQFVSPTNREGTVAFATVNEALQQINEQSTEHFFGAVNAAFTPIDQGATRLTLEANVGFDVANVITNNGRPFGWNIDGFSGTTTDGVRSFVDGNYSELTFDARSLLNTELAGMESNLIFGFQTNISRGISESGNGTGFPGPGLGVVGAASQTSVAEGISEIVNAGLFGQLQVGVTNWAYVTVGGRLDANSAFGNDFNAQFYPKIQASIIPSDMGGWSGLGPVSSLRFLAALGRSGLQPGAFDALTTFSSVGGGIFPANLGNPGLKPEISTEIERGTEFGLFNDKIGVTATYWNRTVNDALYEKQFAVTGGFINRQLENIGEIKGQGFEMAVDAIVYRSGSVSVNAFANAAYLWEQVTDLGGAPPIKVGGTYPRYRNYLVEGFAPGTNFGVKLQDVPAGSLPIDFNGDGNPDTEAEALAWLGDPANAGSGLPTTTTLVLIKSGACPAGQEAQCDGFEFGNAAVGGNANHFLGKPQPDWSGSMGLGIDFGDFSINTLFEYRAGNYFVNNLTDAFRQANGAIGRNLPESARVERDYTNPSSSPEVRLAALDEWLNSQLALNPFSGLNTIKKADWLRWRELSLTYNLPRGVVRNLGLRSAAVTAAGRNLLLFTGYDGLDPEINAIGRGSGGLSGNYLDSVEAFGLPLTRQMLFTLRVGF